MKHKLIDFYLDFVNNYLTIGKFAEATNIPESDILVLLELGQKYNEEWLNRLKETEERIKANLTKTNP
jgi:hypothetical protein